MCQVCITPCTLEKGSERAVPSEKSCTSRIYLLGANSTTHLSPASLSPSLKLHSEHLLQTGTELGWTEVKKASTLSHWHDQPRSNTGTLAPRSPRKYKQDVPMRQAPLYRKQQQQLVFMDLHPCHLEEQGSLRNASTQPAQFIEPLLQARLQL